MARIHESKTIKHISCECKCKLNGSQCVSNQNWKNKEYTINKYPVRDSLSICNEIRKQDLSFYMTSFDIQSLFTNIPLDETIDIYVNRVFNIESQRYVKETVTVKSSCFVFNNVYDKQIYGVAVASSLGPTIANLFLVYYKNMSLDICPLQFKPKYYLRYVDDIFLMFEKEDQEDVLKKFLKYMNPRHQNITFTFEEEHSNKIGLMDIPVTRVGNELQTFFVSKENI